MLLHFKQWLEDAGATFSGDYGNPNTPAFDRKLNSKLFQKSFSVPISLRMGTH